MQICGFFEQRAKVDRARKGTRKRTAWTVSWVNLMNMLPVSRILWFEYANIAWKLRIVCKKTTRSSYMFLFGIGDTNKTVPPVREASIPGPTVRPSQVRSDNQPSVPHPRVHSPIRWADWLSRLRPWGGQTRLTGCHGDLMDWSEQISSPKTPERIAGFQRIALASARWVSFPSSFLRSFLLPSSGLCVPYSPWLMLSQEKMKRLRIDSYHIIITIFASIACLSCENDSLFHFVCLFKSKDIKNN